MLQNKKIKKVGNIKTLKKCVFVFVLTILIQPNLFAQGADASIFKGAEAYISYGLHFKNTSSLNNDLKKYGLPEFGSAQMSVGLGGGAFLKRFYIGGHSEFRFGSNASNDQYHTKLLGGIGVVQGGYALIQTPSVAFYPTLGIGGGGSAILIDEGPSYVENRGKFQPDHNIHTSYMLLDLGVNSDFFAGEGAVKNKFLVGISAGYQLYPFNKDWSYQDQSLSDLSNFVQNGFYIKVRVGLGFFDEI